MNPGLPLPYALQVCFLEAQSNYTLTHTLSGFTEVRRATLTQTAQRYPSFIRIHKQYSVNPDRIVRLHFLARYKRRPLVEVELKTGIRLPVSERQVSSLVAELRIIVQRNHRLLLNRRAVIRRSPGGNPRFLKL